MTLLTLFTYCRQFSVVQQVLNILGLASLPNDTNVQAYLINAIPAVLYRLKTVVYDISPTPIKQTAITLILESLCIMQELDVLNKSSQRNT